MSASLTLRAAIGKYPHTQALKAGRVASERVTFSFEEVEPITRAFRRMVRTLDFDLCEIALTTLAQAHAFKKSITGLPIVVMRGFHHGALMCLRDSPLTSPSKLVGKRVAVRAFSQTTGVWVRGILQDEYGIDPASITWATSEDAHVQEYDDPACVERCDSHQDLLQRFHAGKIDAAVALAGADPARTRPVIPDPEAAARQWFRRTGIYPVNHVICVKSALLDQHPWLGPELCRLFSDAKRLASSVSAEARWGSIVADVLPYGLEANRLSIETCLNYAARQQLIPVSHRPDELFAAE
jgi:4,5-dihydroxyphthalate decarboxylase